MKAKIRFKNLDSLRGIASFQVYLGHLFVAIPTLGYLVYHIQGMPLAKQLGSIPAHLFLTATPAVFMFFVLSGFVLSFPYFHYNQSERKTFFPFLIKRSLRLYIPVVAACLISLLLKHFLYEDKYFQFISWTKEIWKIDNIWGSLKKILCLNMTGNKINPPLWTLEIEIILSPFILLITFLLKKLNRLWSILSLFIYIIFYHTLVKCGLTTMVPRLAIFYYLTFFWGGAVLSKNYETILSKLQNKSNLLLFSALIFALIIYTFDYSLFFLPKELLLVMGRFEHYLYFLASLIVILLSFSPKLKILEHSIFVTLGKYSFSLYLVHQVIIISIIYLFTKINSLELIIYASLATFLITILFFHLFEKPAEMISNYAREKIKAFIK